MQRKVLANSSTPFPTHPPLLASPSPPYRRSETTSKDDSLGPKQKAACGFVFLLSVFLSRLFSESCYYVVVDFLYFRIVVSDSLVIFTHVGITASHHGEKTQLHISTPPHTPRSPSHPSSTHVHFIRACLSTVVTLSLKEPCMNITM